MRIQYVTMFQYLIMANVIHSVIHAGGSDSRVADASPAANTPMKKSAKRREVIPRSIEALPNMTIFDLNKEYPMTNMPIGVSIRYIAEKSR